MFDYLYTQYRNQSPCCQNKGYFIFGANVSPEKGCGVELKAKKLMSVDAEGSRFHKLSTDLRLKV